MATLAGAALATTILAVSAAPGSLAFLQQQTAAGGVTLATGNSGFELAPGSGGTLVLSPREGYSMLDEIASAQVTNTGTVPLAFTGAVGTSAANGTREAEFAQYVQVRAWLSGTSCALAEMPAVGEGRSWRGSAYSGSAGSTTALAPGETARLCLAAILADTSMPSAARNAGSTPIVLTVYGNQVQ